MVSSKRLGRPGALFIVGLVGFLGGLLTVIGVQTRIISPEHPQTSLPLPHHIPKYPGGISLRFAMVHDVLTERFAKHGMAYYTERNQLVRKELQQLKDQAKPGEKPSRYFDLLNDLGAGYEALGQHDMAISVMREKLEEQEALGFKGRDLYTTYANLGTFLIHENFVKARTGDAKAKQLLQEGLEFIHKSIQVNPQAHFRREIWQAVTVEFMLAAIQSPELLLKFDLLWNNLQVEIDPSNKRCFTERQEREEPWWSRARTTDELLRESETKFDDYHQKVLLSYRDFITCAGAEKNWNEAVKTSH